MRDPETMQIAVAAGETGHLVFSSLHTSDVATTVARIADSFPLERQNTVRQELAMALAAVLTQTLMPKIGGGRIPAAELLMVGYGARQQVRKNALQHLHQEITITRKQGSFTLEESLAELVKRELVDRKDALTRAGHPEELERLLGRPLVWTALPFLALAELIAGDRRLAAREIDLEHLLALGVRAVLVLQRRDDLLGARVDHVAGRGVGELAVDAERDPARLVAHLDARLHHRRHHRRVEDAQEVVRVVGDPDLGLVLRHRDAVARDAVRRRLAGRHARHGDVVQDRRRS